LLHCHNRTTGKHTERYADGQEYDDIFLHADKELESENADHAAERC
jgi:hypothetical protein